MNEDRWSGSVMELWQIISLHRWPETNTDMRGTGSCISPLHLPCS